MHFVQVGCYGFALGLQKGDTCSSYCERVDIVSCDDGLHISLVLKGYTVKESLAGILRGALDEKLEVLGNELLPAPRLLHHLSVSVDTMLITVGPKPAATPKEVAK